MPSAMIRASARRRGRRGRRGIADRAHSPNWLAEMTRRTGQPMPTADRSGRAAYAQLRELGACLGNINAEANRHLVREALLERCDRLGLPAERDQAPPRAVERGGD